MDNIKKFVIIIRSIYCSIITWVNKNIKCIGCFCLTIWGRVLLSAIVLLSLTAYGFWELAGLILTGKVINKSQAAVLVSVIFGWTGLVAGVLYIFSRSDDI